MKMPRSSPWIVGCTTWTPAMTSDSVMSAMVRSSGELDAGVVAHEQSGGDWGRPRPDDLDVTTDERVGEPRHGHHAALLEQHRVLDLGVEDLATGGHRREGSDEAVDDAGVRTDGRGSAHGRVDDLCPGLDHDASLDARRVVDDAVAARFDRLEHEPVALEEGILLAGVDPPTLQDLVTHAVAMVDQPLDGVGDLELTARRRFDRAHRGVDLRVEQVHADDREVGRRVLRLLDELHDLAVGAEHGHARL